MPTPNTSMNGQAASRKRALSEEKPEYVSMLNELRACGAACEVGAPTLTILGSRSSGKDSIFEAICGVGVPEAPEPWMECPMEVRSFRDQGRWRCRLSVRLSYTFPTEVPRHEERALGGEMYDPAVVMSQLKRAQVEAFSLVTGIAASIRFDPRTPRSADLFDYCPRRSSCEATLCLTIDGPNCVNLSILNVPGISSRADGRTMGTPDELAEERAQARKAVSRPNSIIVLAVSCASDINDQPAATIAHQADPAGTRTIGILTDVGSLNAGNSAAWIKTLAGTAPSLGYYAVRSLGPADMQQATASAGARQETAMPAVAKPWVRLAAGDLLDTAEFAEDLRALLDGHVSQALPQMIKTLRRELAETTSELEKPPAAVGGAKAYQRLDQLCRNLVATVIEKGITSPINPALKQRMQSQALAGFTRNIMDGPPVFFVQDKGSDGPEPALVDARYTHLYAFRRKTWDDDECLVRNAERDPAEAGKKQRVVYTLEQVRRKRMWGTAFVMPGEGEDCIRNELIGESRDHWALSAAACLRDCERPLTQWMQNSINEEFGSYKGSGLHAKVSAIVAKYQEACLERTEEAISDILGPEMTLVYTNQDKELAEETRILLDQFRDARSQGKGRGDTSSPHASTPSRTGSENGHSSPEAHGNAADTDAGDVTQTVAYDDEYADELQMCAEVLAFYKLTAKRIGDSIPLAIAYHLLRGLGEKLKFELQSELGIGGKSGGTKAAKWLKPDAGARQKRPDLEAMKQRLSQGLDIIREVGVGA